MNPKEEGVTTYTFRIVVGTRRGPLARLRPRVRGAGRLNVGLYPRGSAREYPRGSGDDCRRAGRGRQVGAGRRCGFRGTLGRGHGMTDIPWGALRSLTAREIISAP